MNEKEYEEWYKNCRYIKDELSFYNFKSFVDNAKLIRAKFDNLDRFTRSFYKWYVYANNDISINQKNAIWRYLHHYIEFTELSKQR